MSDDADSSNRGRPDTMGRRRFLAMAGSTVVFSRLVGCTSRPRDRIVPYVEQPRDLVPGREESFATSFGLDGLALGVLALSHEGRPTKIEGHPEHPASLGRASALAQASVLGLYDADRGAHIREGRQPRSYRNFIDKFALGGGARPGTGRGLHLLLEPTSSPLVVKLLAELHAALPEATVHFHAPLFRTERWRGARAAFGKVVESLHHFEHADVVVSIDSDFLESGPSAVRDSKTFMDRRRLRRPEDGMNRLYAAETTLTSTGATADHRLPRRPSEIPDLAARLLSSVVRRTPERAAAMPGLLRERLLRMPPADEPIARWVEAVAGDLADHRGRSLVLAGDLQPWPVHAVVHALNDVLGNANASVTHIAPLHADAGENNYGLGILHDALERGEVETLIILEGNPVHGAPVFDLAEHVERVPRSVYLGLYENETARACQWFLPSLHYLESWGDLRAYDGTVSFVQPLIGPLHGGYSVVDVLALYAGRSGDAHRLLREHWAEQGFRDDAAWERALARGFLDDTASDRVDVSIDWDAVGDAFDRLPAPGAASLELEVRRDAKVLDGRYANNAWLVELPDPVTKLSWGNAALVNPKTASELGLASGAIVDLATRSGHVAAPVLPLRGQAEGSITLALGYGRSGAERLARDVGVNAARLLPADGFGFGEPVTVKSTAQTAALAISQIDSSLEGRSTVLGTTLAARHSRSKRPRTQEDVELYRLSPKGKHQWAMSIDLTTCTGCSACVVACQAENNVPVVGRDWLLRGRGMHWIRIDRYYVDSGIESRQVFQPMMCQHCEKAPCEYVCPVGATTHSDDGLNEMTYNRCVGTRFCSNNCPYKVRRFNFLNYNATLLPIEKLAKNPDVTVRARGVMEKCTYCVQRIRKAEIQAIAEARPFRPSDVTTACAQTCPTGAIVFGSLTDPDSEVARLRSDDRTFAELADLGTRPRTTYLAPLRNPNPDLEAT